MVTSENRPNSVISDRFHIIRTIGTGASATVYLANDTVMQRQVALKVLAPDKSELHLNTRAFENEVEAITTLGREHNPHIVEIFDVSLRQNQKYIVMEYVDGITLRSYMDQHRPLPVSDILNCATQILTALCTAHDHGIIHRDIKPQNVIVTGEGTLKVTDFGIAKLSNIDRFAIKDRAVGTVYYISPEQVTGETVDERSDIYSLGVLLYELATGRLPFDGTKPEVIAQKQLTDLPTPPCALRPDLPVGLEQIILCAMKKDPAERFQTAADMGEAINQIRKEPEYVFPGSPAEYSSTNIKPVAGLTALFRAHMFRNSRKTPPSEKKRKWRLFWILSGAGVLVAALTVALIISLSGRSLTMPNLVGKIYNDDLYYEMVDGGDGIRIDKVDPVYSDGHRIGTILEQHPAPGEKVPAGTLVTVKVVVGPIEKPLVNLTGNYESAKANLESKVQSTYGSCQITWKVSYQLVENGTPGTILSWESSEGAGPDGDGRQYVSKDCTISVSVVMDPAKINALVGKTMKDAKTLLGSWGIKGYYSGNKADTATVKEVELLYDENGVFCKGE